MSTSNDALRCLRQRDGVRGCRNCCGEDDNDCLEACMSFDKEGAPPQSFEIRGNKSLYESNGACVQQHGSVGCHLMSQLGASVYMANDGTHG